MMEDFRKNYSQGGNKLGEDPIRWIFLDLAGVQSFFLVFPSISTFLMLQAEILATFSRSFHQFLPPNCHSLHLFQENCHHFATRIATKSDLKKYTLQLRYNTCDLQLTTPVTLMVGVFSSSTDNQNQSSNSAGPHTELCKTG